MKSESTQFLYYMQWISADVVFDGYKFHESLYLFVDDSGLLIHKQKDKPDGDIRMLPGLLMPGMVNAHCHLELSDMQDMISSGTGLVNFLSDVNKLNRLNADKKKEREVTKQEKITAADETMYNNGIVVVGDICNTLSTIPQKTQSKIYYHSFIEAICIDPEQVENRFFHYSNIYYEFQQQMSASLSLHAPYTCCNELFEEVAKRSNFVSIHNQESQAENDFFEKGEGDFVNFLEGYQFKKEHILKEQQYSSSLDRTTELLAYSDKRIYVHNTYTAGKDISKAGSNDYWCFCPKANLYIENRLPDMNLFLSKQDKIVLGTDSLASNDTLNIIAEVKAIQDAYPAIPLENILRWATSNGAKLFDVEELFGSFSLGSTPGYVHVEGFDTEARSITSTEIKRIA